MKILGKIVTFLEKIEEALIIAGLLFMTGMNFINVLSRKFFSGSISFTEEIIIIVFVWVTMLGIAVGYKRKAHLGMSFVIDHLPKALKKPAAVFIYVCSLILICIIFYYGIQTVQSEMRFNMRTTALRWPKYVQTLAIPVGAVLMGIHTVQAGISELKEEK